MALGEGMKLRLLTINLHKGFSPLNRRFVLPQLRDCVHSAAADVIFLQEVVGENLHRAASRRDWPDMPQHEYLAEPAGFDHVYGRNAVYSYGHHGNAILSRFPILFFDQADISTNRLEKRGLLYAKLELPGRRPPLNCICVHLGLLCRSRVKQLRKVSDYIRKYVPPGEPLVVAGDFNEWRPRKRSELETVLHMKDAGAAVHGRRLRTFPAAMPVFPLDRVYLRGLKPLKARVLRKGVCAGLSDHAGFLAKAELAG